MKCFLVTPAMVFLMVMVYFMMVTSIFLLFMLMPLSRHQWVLLIQYMMMVGHKIFVLTITIVNSVMITAGG